MTSTGRGCGCASEALARPGLVGGDPRRPALLSGRSSDAPAGHALRALDAFSDAIDCCGDPPADSPRPTSTVATCTSHRGRAGRRLAGLRGGARSYELAGRRVARGEGRAQPAATSSSSRGDLVGALRAMEAAYADARSGGPGDECRSCEQDRAEVLMAAGLLDEGAAMLARRPAPTGRGGCASARPRRSCALPASLLATTHRRPRRALGGPRAGSAALGADAWRARAEAEVLAADVELGGSVASVSVRRTDLCRGADRAGSALGLGNGRCCTRPGSRFGAGTSTPRARS